MGEIDNTTKGTPGGDQVPPGGKGETTPNDTPQTFTQEQVDKAIHASLTQAGRDDKALETKRTELNQQAESIEATKREVERLKQEQDAALMESIKSNPDAVDWVQKNKELQDREKTLKKQQDDFNKTKLAYDGKIKAADDAQREIVVYEVATGKKVDLMRLKSLADKLGINDKDKLEELADELATTATTTTIDPDPGTTVGGKKSTTDMTADEKLNKGFAEASKKK